MQHNITYREKDKNIQAIISYKDDMGKWKQKSKQGFPRKKDAKAWADNMIDQLKEQNKFRSNSEFDGILFGDFVKIYSEHAALHMEPNTIKALKIALKRFSNLNDIELQKISSLDIQQLADDMVREGLKGSTIRIYLKYLGMIFNSAYKDYRLINYIPSKGIKIAQEKTKESQRALNDKELEQLLNEFKNSKYYLLLYLLSKTGLRVGEALGLTRQDIDLKNCEIDVNKQWKEISNGKHDFGVLKTKNSNRKVPIPKYVADEFQKHMKVISLQNDRIFDFNTTNLQSAMSTLFKKKGYDYSLHTLRHTYVTKLVASGMDFKTVAEIAGHSVEMVMKTYSHVNSDMKEKAKKHIENVV